MKIEYQSLSADDNENSRLLMMMTGDGEIGVCTSQTISIWVGVLLKTQGANEREKKKTMEIWRIAEILKGHKNREFGKHLYMR